MKQVIATVMGKRLQHAAAAILITTAASARAQISDPNKLIAPTPSNPARSTAHRADTAANDLQWLWKYTRPEPNGNAAALLADQRFADLLAARFPQPQAMWGTTNAPLAGVVQRFLARNGEVRAERNRYLTIDGCVPSFCDTQGLLWIDLGRAEPQLLFAGVNWTTASHATTEANADFNLWVFADRAVSGDALPYEFTRALGQWQARLAAAHRRVPHISHALLVEPNGNPVALDPAALSMNILAPQADTVTPPDPEDNE